MTEKAKYVQGVGWRRETIHRYTRRHLTHNYRGVGTYEVTLTVAGRRPVFGRVEGTTRTVGSQPHLVPSALGRKVLEEELPKIHNLFPMVEIWQVCLMPDHIHLIVRVSSELPEGKYLGNIIGAFKGGVSRAWWKMQPAGANPGAVREPLFDEGFNDRILMRDGQLENWKRYLNDNHWRLLFRQEHPDIMKRVLCLTIDGVRYGAFGNLLLLRYPEKQQVFFHRRTGGMPTEDTPFWTQEHDRLTDAAEAGDVLVTPGISECEKRIKNEALQRHLKLIHLQADPIGPYWKPERSRFDACTFGTLLILAPWHEDLPCFESAYQRYHYLNRLCASICAIGAGTRLGLRTPEAEASGTGAKAPQAASDGPSVGSAAAPSVVPSVPVPSASAAGPLSATKPQQP